MPVDKDKMKALALAAGGAAWSEPSQEYNDRGYRYWQIVDSADVEVTGDYGLSEEVARFVATANPAAVLELLAENDKLNQERDELSKTADAYRAQHTRLINERDELRAEVERLREVLLKIERVNAMDYEYRRWAREAVNNR